MLTLRTCESLDYLNDSDWKGLWQSTLEEGTHPERIKTFCFAREALRLALREQGHNPEISDLVLRTYHSLSAFPELTVSLSHTRNFGVALVGRRKNFRSLGVDVERINRVARDEIIQKVAHPQDAKLRNIEIWVMKEAAFKCVVNSEVLSTPPLFTDLQILPHSWRHTPSGLEGKLQLQREGEFLIALATLEHPAN